MYHFNLSLDMSHKNWFYQTEKMLLLRLREHGAIMAHKEDGLRLQITIACENKDRNKIKTVIKDSVVDMFLSVVKPEFLENRLKLPQMKKDLYDILIQTLKVFDRETEKEIIEKSLVINNELALDGLYNFKLAELRNRWEEIAALASNNSLYLNNEETFNELLKFLMSAVSPQILKLDIIINKDRYKIKGSYKDGSFEYCELCAQQLMTYLINIAPLELTLYGRFEDERLFNRLKSIFDAKQQNIH